MIEGSKQQQLTFEKGITNVPSDLLCSDNALEESVGMIYDNGEHRVIQKPNEYITSAQTTAGTQMDVPVILYIHKLNNLERYIGHIPSGEQRQLCWGIVEDKVFKLKGMFMKGQTALYYTDGTNITSIGKTLVYSGSGGMDYFLWKDGEYGHLGPIPEPEFNFWLVCEEDQGILPSVPDRKHVLSEGDATGIIFKYSSNYRTKSAETYNDLVLGLYSKNKKNIKSARHFCNPFYIRTAIELYDGSYTHLSQPILMFPGVKENTYAVFFDIPAEERSALFLHTHYSELHFTQRKDFSNWSDIVKDLAIFVSDEIDVHNLIADQSIDGLNTDIVLGQECKFDGVFRESQSSTTSKYIETTVQFTVDIDETHIRAYLPLVMKEEKTLINDIKTCSLFYKLCSIGLESIDSDTDISSVSEQNVLVNLTTQEHIEYDDYYSRCQLIPNLTYSYNSRLNIADVKRGFFEGFDFFMPWDNLQSAIYDIYVTIKTDVSDVVVKHTTPPTQQKMGYYFYYPDSRATKVVILDVSNNYAVVLNAKLTEHPGLNGAYYFAGLPAETPPQRATDGGGSTAQTPLSLEILPNYIIQSEVNNPWVFMAEGYNKVGTSKIIGMSTITQALSQGQFGQFPLIVFSESGIWAMSVADTGYYSAIHPMSREVCNNVNSITQTDGAVFFSSEKGLMVVVGGDVRCVSEQLSGRNADFTGEISMGNFRDYLKNCFIAYDYRDSLLWIFNNSRQQNNKFCYVYSIKSGTFGKFEFVAPITNVVNNYPDYLLQTGSRVYSLTERVNINLDPDEYDGLIITRPMKLENGLALKSLMQVRHIKQMQGGMTLRIFASNNTEHWVELHSLRGTPWKYYRFRYDFTSLAATDRFAGSVVITQERRTDKLL